MQQIKNLHKTLQVVGRSQIEIDNDITNLIQIYNPQLYIVRITPLVDGLTNQLYKVITKDMRGCEELFVLRVYGSDSSVIVDRGRENLVLKNLELLKAEFNNGVVLRYAVGESLISKQLVLHREKIAKAMARLHKAPLFLDSEGNANNEFFSKTRAWIAAAKERDPDWTAYVDIDENTRKVIHFSDIDRELLFIENQIQSANYHLVCGHNDVNAENCIFNKEDGSITFIDFEYSMNNVRGFDIANHFCEYSGVSTNFDFNFYPSKEMQLPFLRYYLEGFNGRQPTEEELDSLYDEVNRCAMMSHFFWGIWGVVQKAISALDFDFVFYSKARYDQYFRSRALYPNRLQYK